MKLYYTKGACSLVVRIILNELEQPFESELVELRTKKTEHGVDFLTINNKGAVPVLQLDSGEILTENTVILQYLADTFKAYTLLPQLGHFKRYRVLEWLNYITTELHKSFGSLFNPTIDEAIKTDTFIPLIKSKLAYVNSQLQGRTYLMGDEFTLPDAYLFVMLRWAMYFKIDLKEYNHLEMYLNTLGKRQSIQMALKQEG
ncbi:MAG: glutathione transferase GstA [Tatlockia sp.]|jgi:glutathione S-transferase